MADTGLLLEGDETVTPTNSTVNNSNIKGQWPPRPYPMSAICFYSIIQQTVLSYERLSHVLVSFDLFPTSGFCDVLNDFLFHNVKLFCRASFAAIDIFSYISTVFFTEAKRWILFELSEDGKSSMIMSWEELLFDN